MCLCVKCRHVWSVNFREKFTKITEKTKRMPTFIRNYDKIYRQKPMASYNGISTLTSGKVKIKEISAAMTMKGNVYLQRQEIAQNGSF